MALGAGGVDGRRADRHPGPAAQRAGARATPHGGRLGVTDGPFTETKELISYALYDVRSKEEAVEWTNRFLRLHQDCGRAGRARPTC